MRLDPNGWWVVEDDDLVVDFDGTDRMKTVLWLVGESKRRGISIDALLEELIEIDSLTSDDAKGSDT